MTLMNASTGLAPVMRMPLTRKAGVLEMPAVLAASRSAWTVVLVSAEVRHCLNWSTIQTDFAGVAQQVVVTELPVVLEEGVVVLPEFPLAVGAHSGLGGGSSARMAGQREVAENEPDVLGVLPEELFDGGTRAFAEGTLEVAELDDGDRRTGRASGRTLRGDLVTGGFQQNDGVGLLAQLRENFASPLLPEEDPDLRRERLERGAAHLLAVLVVKGLDLLVGDSAECVDFLLHQLCRRQVAAARLGVHHALVDHILDGLRAQLVKHGGIAPTGLPLEEIVANPLVQLVRGDGFPVELGDDGHAIGCFLSERLTRVLGLARECDDEKDRRRGEGANGHGVSFNF